MNSLAITHATEDPSSRERDWLRITRGILSTQLLRMQNRLFRRTGGTSRNNRAQGFVPAYLNSLTGKAVESRFADGRGAPIHVLDGLPADWIQERDPTGRVLKARPGIIAGFLRGDRFYTREQAAQAVAQEQDGAA